MRLTLFCVLLIRLLLISLGRSAGNCVASREMSSQIVPSIDCCAACSSVSLGKQGAAAKTHPIEDDARGSALPE